MSSPNRFNLPLEERKRYIEFGGGDKPVVRAGKDVRVDVRPCLMPDGSPAVDFVVDLEKPFTEEHGQAISTGEFDGAVSVYALEHVSWRKVPQLLGEIRRVLKDDGSLFLLIPNTEAQMRHLLETQDWDDAGSMLFGGQDYGENAHKAAFSPASITRQLTDAGFMDVQIQQFGEKGTDMAVFAKCRPTMKQWPGHPQPMPPLAAPAPSPPADELAEMSRRMEQAFATGEGLGPPQVMPRGVTIVVGEGDLRHPPGTVLGLMPEGMEVGPGKPDLTIPAADLPIPAADLPEPLPPDLLDLWLSPPTALQVQRASLFRRQYFDGGLEAGGGYQLYLDFPCHEVTAQAVLAMRPASVLELGCGRGYVLKRIQDVGNIPVAHGWDISRHCYLSRVCDGIDHADATDAGRWRKYVDNCYDLCYSVAFLDHVPEELLTQLIAQMVRVCRRSIHGVNFDPKGGDSTRATRRPKEWWDRLMPPGHVVVDKSELEDGPAPPAVLRGDGKLKLNVGCAMTMFHHGWVNVDSLDYGGYAQHHRYAYLRHDVREGLPYGTGSVDLVFCCHALEHLTYAEGFELLREFRRVLKPSGCLRVIVPGLASLVGKYTAGVEWLSYGTDYLSEFDELSSTVAAARTPGEKLYELCFRHHQSAYDYDTLAAALVRVGFEVSVSRFRHAAVHEGFAQMHRECLDVLPEVSLFMNAVPGSF